MKIERVGVLGAGLMGSGIAEVAAKAGYRTLVREVSEELARKGLSRVENSLARAVERGKLAGADRDAARARLSTTTSLEELADCDILIEAIVENLDAKKETFRALDAACKPAAIFCSNTSSLTITEMSAATSRPDRFAGLHFFNPVPVMKLVEVVRTIATSEETEKTVFDFARSLGKEPIRANDNSGFVVNRLLVPYLLDFVGLDTTYAIAEIMFNEYREKRFAPPPLLKRLVLAGRFGKKSGRGFYEYGETK